MAFVLIGGAAIQSHGRRFDTEDVDVTPDADQANLARLAATLNGLECRLRSRSEQPPFKRLLFLLRAILFDP